MQSEASASDPDRVAARVNVEPLSELTLGGQLLLPVAVFVIALLTIKFSRVSNYTTTLWTPNAIVLVALLRHQRNLRSCGSIFLGGALAIGFANLAAGNGAINSAILGAVNMLEVGVALAFLSILKIDASNLTLFKNLLLFIAVACGLAPLGVDAIGAMALGKAHGLPWVTLWQHSYPAHALGMTLVAPCLVSLTSRHWVAIGIERRRGEALFTLMLVILVTAIAAYFRSFIVIVVPTILLATLRFGLIGATVATLVVALIASSFIVLGIGTPLLSLPEISERILAFQVLVAMTSLWSLPIAALLTERDTLLNDLSRANALLKIESERKSHMVTGLHRHLSIAEEKERLRLSYELHDQAGQGLVAAILELGAIDPLTEGAARQRLQQVRRRMEELGKTLHRIAWELRPPSIDELGLQKALASYIDDWAEQCGTEVDFHCDDPNLDQIPNEIGSAVYRIVQEGLTNIVKHAQQPSSVSVVVRRVNAMLQVIVEDDGCGFDVAALAAKPAGYRGLGLNGMRERLGIIGGTLDIESSAGAGTTIFVRIPLDGQRSAA